ncbi:MAG: MgtC/SapB family protein [candidate division WOR-3 bacterium]|nr:MgtC/SapB family protein [candidate division WOR-3 bacterium]
MSNDLTIWDFTLRISVSLIVGALIGLERQFRNRHAGMRTFAILCMSSTMIALIGIIASDRFDNSNLSSVVVAIILSMGFLGAGVIYREKKTMVIIHGLTTSTTLLQTAIIGIAIGLGLLIHAFIASLLTILILVILRGIELKTGLKKNIPEAELRE